MARKINPALLIKMTNGDLLPLLNYVKSDKNLRLEVRQGGKAFIYYRKGKALEIGLHTFSVDEKYLKGTVLSKSYAKLAKTDPASYFREIKMIIDNYVDKIKKRSEFDTQQIIASNNQQQDSRYIIIDMEYSFPQSDLEKEKRVKKAGFDLLGLERETGKVVFFEVKKGGKALKGNSGIETHIKDFEKHLFGENKDFFREILKKDIENIIFDKAELGLIEYSLPDNYKIDDNNIDFIFAYEPDKETSISEYRKIFNQESDKAKSNRVYSSLFVSPANKYNLSYRESERIKMMEWCNKLSGKHRNFILNDGKQNLYSDIADETVEYFEKNNIAWWTCKSIGDIDDTKPTRHLLSSQISCLNHLFSFRNDKKAIEDIFRLPNAEKIEDGYIAFEYVNKNKTYLKESCETRGTKCTSIDAFVKANNIGIGIEWKYTETDFDTAKAQSYWRQRYDERYKPLLKESNIIENDALISCQMYYELMRQTLLLEQMKVHNEISDYKNIVVCPKDNKELYDCCQKWKTFLKDNEKFEIIDPKDLLVNIDKIKYKELRDYLETRYW